MTILSRIFSPTPRRPEPATRQGKFDWLSIFSKVADALHNYQDIPRRSQKLWLTTLVGSLLLIGGISAIYLNLTTRAAIAGREIQDLEESITIAKRMNADLQTKISGTLSKISLEDRAVAAGFEPVTRDNVAYLVVAGYFPEQQPAIQVTAEEPGLQIIPEEYTETLFTWLARQLKAASTPLAQTQ